MSDEKRYGPTMREIVDFVKATQSYKDAVARDNEPIVERMKRSPLLRALTRKTRHDQPH